VAIDDTIRTLVGPVLDAHEVDLYDLEFTGGVLRITVQRDGGVGIDVIGAVSREISRLVDETDPIPGAFTLEVSSPGLERRLRTPEHFAGALGEQVAVKAVAGVDGERRIAGTLADADDRGITVALPDGERRHLAHDQIERARTTFEWGPSPRPGKSPSSKQSPSSKKKAAKP